MSPPDQQVMPRNAVVVLLDSLNRHHLGAYGGGEFDTPALDRFARSAVRFDRHYAGSMPCMPARHDLLVGALDFLWRPWGSVEVWEDAITFALRQVGVTTMLVSDHPHLFESGGENYHTDFHAWDYLRGSENDPWRLVPDPSAIGAPEVPEAVPSPYPRPYDLGRTWFRGEADFPGPRTMAAATRWVETNAAAHDRFLLVVDEFDPHEPFDTPEPHASRYDPGWQGPKLIWPPYLVGAVSSGRLTPEAARQLRASYGAGLTMIDAWLGRLLDALDAAGLAEDTAVFVLTDHGIYLGEQDCEGRDLWGKPASPLYEPIARIPLLVRWPGQAPRALDALTTTVDVHATLCELFGVEVPHRTHGRSLVPLITGAQTSGREWLLSGVYGNWVHVVSSDGVKYARSHVGERNLPLSMWSNRWSTMPIPFDHTLRLPRPDRRAFIDFMPGSDVPVLRQPFAAGDLVPYWAAFAKGGAHHLFDLADDPGERRNLSGVDRRREDAAVELLRTALTEVEAPVEHLDRMGIA